MDDVLRPNLSLMTLKKILNDAEELNKDVLMEIVEKLETLINEYSKGDIHFTSDIYIGNELIVKSGVLHLEEQSTDPSDPVSGRAVIWLSTTDDGSLRMKYTDATGTKEGVIAF